MAVDAAEALEQAIERYNAAWNAHDLDTIMSMHAPDMVFHNHTAGEEAVGPAVRDHIAAIFSTWPDIAFTARRLYVREGLVVQEWTATATHPPARRARSRGPTSSQSPRSTTSMLRAGSRATRSPACARAH